MSEAFRKLLAEHRDQLFVVAYSDGKAADALRQAVAAGLIGGLQPGQRWANATTATFYVTDAADTDRLANILTGKVLVLEATAATLA